MNAKKCDRCKKYFEIKDFVIIKTKLVTNGTYAIFEHEYDLCKDCQEKFYNFLNNYEEVEEDEKK